MRPKNEATRRDIVVFIRNFTESQGYPPSMRDIQLGCELASTSQVSYHLGVLQEQGVITRRPNTARSVVVVDG